MSGHSPTETRDELREVIREWLQKVIRGSGLSATEIARRAGMATTTLTRFLNNPEHQSVPSLVTIEKVARVTKYAPPPGLGVAADGIGFSEPEISPYQGAATGDEEAGDWWEIGSRVLDLEGFMPGDRVLVSLRQPPRAGSVVVAQIVARGGEEVETVFRKYEPPFLTARSTVANQPKPVLIDPEKVSIMGVVLRLHREMQRDAS